MSFLPTDLSMQIPQQMAFWLFLVSLPACLSAAWTDLKYMKIRNKAVLHLAAAFVVTAPFLMPLEQVGWQLVHLGVLLLIGIVINAVGLVGAGDAKFIAAAGPYVILSDWPFLVMLFSVVTLTSVALHRLARATPLRQLAPDWESWARKGDFPMGFPLGLTLSLYLLAGALQSG